MIIFPKSGEHYILIYKPRVAPIVPPYCIARDKIKVKKRGEEVSSSPQV
jgi:hypothetical protein